MTSLAARVAKVRRAVDRRMGETFRHIPMKDAADRAGAPVTDLGRPVADVVGIWSDRAEKAEQADAYDQRTDKRPGAAASSTMIYLHRDAGPFSVRRHDHLVRQSDGAVYRVSASIPSGRLRIQCTVNRLS